MKNKKFARLAPALLSTRTFLAVLAVALLPSSRSFAINLLVYNNNDSGAGSLRQVVSDNNALGGGNTVIFSNVVTGTITLTSGELLISKDLTLIGPGANVLTVSGNNASRVFMITNGIVSISGLTVSAGLGDLDGGGEGGGIYNQHSTLTISNCTFSGNSAGSGGAIVNDGYYGGSATLTVIASTFSGNTAAGYGGGIFNDGELTNNSATLTISNCTFNGNSATGISGDGGAINNFSYSSGSATLTVVASTFNGNLAYDDGSGGGGGGIYNFAGPSSNTKLTVIASTFSGNSGTNGGGILNFGYSSGSASLQIGGTILKAGSSGVNITNYSGTTVTSLGYNLSSDNGGGFLTGVGDQINTDPKLGPLQDNGGPTWTMMPLAGSPALDQGRSFGLSTDQRGQPRTYDNPAIPNASAGDGSDIGAVEVGPPVAFLVVSNNNDSGAGSLRQAILNVNMDESDTIAFASNVTGAITLTSGQLVISHNLTLNGPGANVLAVSGNHASRVFYVTNATVSISGLTVSNGSTGSIGGAILNDRSVLTISNCTLSGNAAASGGGGIYNRALSANATLAVIGCTISDNTSPALASGGGIFNDGSGGMATLTVSNCTLSGNSSGSGGGIYNGGNGGTANLAVIASTLSSNSASSGGGIYNDGSPGSAAMEIANTILKTGPSGANIINTGTITSDGYNLSSDGGGGFLTAATDQINTDPKLGPLQDNGGPTFTHALLSNSPAIDKGKSFGVTTDQRGAPRPYDFSSIANVSGGDGSDIGAFELGRPTLNIQPSNANVVLSWQSYYGDFTLQSVTNVIASNSWATVAGMPVVVASQYVLTNVPISGNQFYRLFRPE